MDLKKTFVTTEDVVILPGAMVNGDVTLGRGCSVWYNAVIRGDVSPIRIGEDTNIQDNAVLHTSYDIPLVLGRALLWGTGPFSTAVPWRTMCSLAWGPLCWTAR